MDGWTRQHLWTWAEANFTEAAEAEKAIGRITAFVAVHPVVLKRGDSWIEILNLATR